MYIYAMGNSGSFKKGHKPSASTKAKQIEGLIKSWPSRHDFHGMYGTKFYNSWRSMTTRCRGTAGEGSKKKYLNRGVRVCERWLLFKNFYDDMYGTYVEGLTIDRIKNSEGYYLENCRWATPKQQGQNKGNTIRIEYLGKKLTFWEWSKELNISIHTIKDRYYKKYIPGLISIDKVFSLSLRS